MSTPDFVEETLNFLDTNWSTTNYSPKPRLIDRRDSREYPSGERVTDHDLTDNAAIGVADPEGYESTPEGLGWEYDAVEGLVRIRVEAAHGGNNEWGGIDGASQFKSLVDEAERCLKVERKWPLEDYHHLQTERADPDPQAWGDYYRTDLVARYVGKELLP